MGGSLTHPIADLSGKVAVVTGGNTGVGYETAKTLALMGAHTIIACRSEEKATAAIGQMRQEISVTLPDKEINVEFMKLDLASFKSVRDFTIAFKEKNLPLNLLVNNAGMFSPSLRLTDDGNEIHFQVNHLGHFLLTLEFIPLLLDSASQTGDSRIVIVTSTGHTSGVYDPTNFNGEREYSSLKFYCNSKLHNVMHGFALQRRLNNVGITVSSVHPGFVKTDIFVSGSADRPGLQTFMKISRAIMSPGMRSWQQGSVTSLNCAVNPELNKQQHFYYADCRVTPSIATAENTELQEQLWEVSVNKVKDWITPEILEKYGTRMDVTPPTDEVPVTPPSDDTPVTLPTDDTPVTPPSDDTPVTPPTDDTPVTPPTDDTPVTDETPMTPPSDDTPVTLPTGDTPVTPPSNNTPVTDKTPMTPPTDEAPVTLPTDETPVTPPTDKTPVTPPTDVSKVDENNPSTIAATSTSEGVEEDIPNSEPVTEDTPSTVDMETNEEKQE